MEATIGYCEGTGMKQVNQTQQSKSKNQTKKSSTQEANSSSDEHKSTHKLRVDINPRWSSTIGIVTLGVFYLFFPAPVTIGPNWSLLAVEVVLLLPLVLSWLTRHKLPDRIIRVLSLTILGVVTLALASGVFLMVKVIHGDIHATRLLRTSALLWVSNVLVFALWYWEIDGGGPMERSRPGYQPGDFLFPKQASGNAENWNPHFLDYLFLAFNTATAFSPTATYPSTDQAKVLMMVESMTSLLIVTLLASRAVNII